MTACASGTWCSMINPATSSLTLRGVWGMSARNVWVVGDTGTILHYDGRWTRVTSGTSERLHAVWGTAANRVWAAGENGALLKYEGKTWKQLPTLSGNNFYGVGGGTNPYAVGQIGSLGLIKPLPSSKPKLLSGVQQFNAIWGLGTTAYAVGQQKSRPDGEVYRFSANKWLQIPVPLRVGPLFGVWGPAAGGRVIVVGGRIGSGIVLEDNGKGFAKAPITPRQRLHGTAGLSGTVYAVGQRGLIVRCSNMANPCKPWTVESSRVTTDLYAVWMASPATVFAVGAKGTILIKQ